MKQRSEEAQIFLFLVEQCDGNIRSKQSYAAGTTSPLQSAFLWDLPSKRETNYRNLMLTQRILQVERELRCCLAFMVLYALKAVEPKNGTWTADDAEIMLRRVKPEDFMLFTRKKSSL